MRGRQMLRQWTLLKHLQAGAWLSIRALTIGLPPDLACHPRTVRRDIDLLSLIFPIGEESGKYTMRGKL